MVGKYSAWGIKYGGKDKMAGWERSDATYPKSLAEFVTSKLMKGSKESRQNRSQVSASFHRRTEHGGKEEG